MVCEQILNEQTIGVGWEEKGTLLLGKKLPAAWNCEIDWENLPANNPLEGYIVKVLECSSLERSIMFLNLPSKTPLFQRFESQLPKMNPPKMFHLLLKFKN